MVALAGRIAGLLTVMCTAVLAADNDFLALFGADVTLECINAIRASGLLPENSGGRPLKTSSGSGLHQIRNELVKNAISHLVVDDESDEGELIGLCQSGLKDKINRGYTNMGQNAPAPELTDVGCMGALPFTCSDCARFRTISGVCNNLEHPLFGSADIAFRRFIPAAYADHMSVPRGGFASSDETCETGGLDVKDFCPCVNDPAALLPTPRRVSLGFHPVDDAPADATHLFTIFSQFVDHDVTLTPENPEEECCDEGAEERQEAEGGKIDLRGECFSFFAPTCLTRGVFSAGHCFPFGRSVAFCDDQSRGREQMNGITAFVDSSNVYGSGVETAALLRSFEGGRLLEGENGLLPMLDDGTGVVEERGGDVRARENPALSAVHTIFLREHNRLADLIAQRTGFADERVYEEARRILGAEMQNIIYGQWMTLLLGEKTMQDKKLALKEEFDIYDPEIDPSIRNSFATAAFRFGHTMIQGVIEFFTLATEQKAGAFDLRDSFFDTSEYQRNGGEGFQEILLGLMLQAAQSRDRFIENDLTDFLFENVEGEGTDLMARNIQRGRDHGIPSYNDFREFCGMERACSWDEPPAELDAKAWEELRQLYDSPADVDLWPAGIAERSHEGGLLGRTFNCLVGTQFQHLKFGDRFFFTNRANPYPFNFEQIENLKARTLGDVICDTTAVESVSDNVFVVGDLNVKCGQHNKLDIDLFC